MTSERTPLIEVSRLVKNYQGLRPLRIRVLAVHAGERVAIAGLDAPAAEVFVNLVTGATLPDEGDVRIFGTHTASIMSDTQWLGSLDRFGIVSHRAVLLEASTVEQNLALPFTLEIEPISEDVREQVGAIARQINLSPEDLATVIGRADPSVRCRVHLGRALALNPSVLLLEHAAVALDADAVEAFARDLVAVAKVREIAVLILTQDARLAELAADRRLTLQAATGELLPSGRRVLRWF